MQRTEEGRHSGRQRRSRGDGGGEEWHSDNARAVRESSDHLITFQSGLPHAAHQSLQDRSRPPKSETDMLQDHELGAHPGSLCSCEQWGGGSDGHLTEQREAAAAPIPDPLPEQERLMVRAWAVLRKSLPLVGVTITTRHEGFCISGPRVLHPRTTLASRSAYGLGVQ